MYFGLVRNYFGILKCWLVWNSKNCISLDYLATEFRQKYLEAEFVTTGEDWGLNGAEFVTTGEDWGLNEAEFITYHVDWGINGAEVVTTGEDWGLKAEQLVLGISYVLDSLSTEPSIVI